MLFTDPRFFTWVWEFEEEIHQMCPIVYWHLWDQSQFGPTFNKVLFDSTDLLNCINYPTYEFLKGLYPQNTHPNRVNFVPHALPKELFHPTSPEQSLQFKRALLKGRPDDEFVALWIGRNARRKRPADLLWSWRTFLDQLQEKHGHQKATLLMHTDPLDQEGPNLLQVVELLKLHKNVVFSRDRTSFEDMNRLYAVSDVVVNVSMAEGFGLPILEGMYSAKPVIAVKTGGLERQVVDHRDGSENGIALPVEFQSMVGSQLVPWILEDMTSIQTIAGAFMKMYEMGPEKRTELGQKAMAYAHHEFDLQNLINTWDTTLDQTISTWRNTYKPWDTVEL